MPIIEHKFKMSLDTDEDIIDERMGTMIFASVLMVTASLTCFVLAGIFSNQELKQEAELKSKNYR